MKIFIALLVVVVLLFACGVGAGATRGSDRIDSKNLGVPDITGLFTRGVQMRELVNQRGCQNAPPLSVLQGATCTILVQATGVFGLRRMKVRLSGVRLEVSWDKPFVNRVSLRGPDPIDLIFTGDATTLTLSGCISTSALAPCTLIPQ